MAVSKRIRYEVLRRDGYQCRYCRATDAPLTVDHVTPVALGGSNDPSNLVAACRDCNAGKTSTSPDAALVADVREDALRHAEMVRQAYAVLEEQRGERIEFEDSFWVGWEALVGEDDLPPDWRVTLGRWFAMGVPMGIISDGIERAVGAQQTRNYGRFRYMCAHVWKHALLVDETAASKEKLEGSFISDGESQRMWCTAWDLGHERGYADALTEMGIAR